MQRKAKVIIILVISFALLVDIGFEIKQRVSETWWSILSNIQFEETNMTVYTNVDGVGKIGELTSVGSLQGFALSKEEVKRFIELFNEQTVDEYWYGIYKAEQYKYYTYDYDVVLEIADQTIMIDTYDEIAYYVGNKNTVTEPYKFELSKKQEEYIESLIEKYGTKEYGELIENVIYMAICMLFVIAIIYIIVVKRRRMRKNISIKVGETITKLKKV